MVAESNIEQSKQQRWMDQHLTVQGAKTPRAYQKEVFAALDRHFKDSKRGLTHLATGAGKTFITVEWLRRQLKQGHISTKKPVIWMVHRCGLLEPAMKELFAISKKERKSLGLGYDSVAILGNCLNKNISSGALPEGENGNALFYFTTPQSFSSLYGDFKKTPSFIVWDECHHGDNKGQQGPRILKHFKRKRTKVIGLSATPTATSCSFKKADLVYSKGLGDLIRTGHLARPNPIRVNTNVAWTPEIRGGHNSDYANTGVLNTAKRNRLIVEHYVHHRKKYGKTIVFAINIDHAEALIKVFAQNNVTATYIHSDMDARTVRKNVDDYLSGRKEVIINISMLTVGFDAPNTKTIFMCRPTNSETFYLQSIGRGTRIPSGSSKRSFFVVDFVDNLKRHSESLYNCSRLTGTSRSSVRRARSSEMQRSIREGKHFFEHSQTPSYICPADGLPAEMEGLLYYPNQTFGVEIELTGPEFWDYQVYRREGLKLIRALTSALSKSEVKSTLGPGQAAKQWHVERDMSCGWEVVSPVLNGVEGIQKLVTVMNTLNTFVERSELTVNFLTGLHVHLGYSSPKLNEVRSLVLHMHKVEPYLGALVSRSRTTEFVRDGVYDVTKPNEYCTPIRKQLTKKALKESRTVRQLVGKVKERYATLNLKPLTDISTVEFRLHNGTTEALKIVRWISICQQVFHQGIQQANWEAHIKDYTRRTVIKPATTEQFQQWVKTLPGGTKELFVASTVKRVRELRGGR